MAKSAFSERWRRQLNRGPVPGEETPMRWLYISKASNGQFYVRIEGGNHETIAVTETYVSKASALHAANLIKAGGGTIVDLS